MLRFKQNAVKQCLPMEIKVLKIKRAEVITAVIIYKDQTMYIQKLL